MNDLIPVIAASPLRQRLIDDMTLHKIYASFAYIAWRDSLRLCLLPPKKRDIRRRAERTACFEVRTDGVEWR